MRIFDLHYKAQPQAH